LAGYVWLLFYTPTDTEAYSIRGGWSHYTDTSEPLSGVVTGLIQLYYVADQSEISTITFQSLTNGYPEMTYNFTQNSSVRLTRKNVMLLNTKSYNF
jgi:hypothetical protein